MWVKCGSNLVQCATGSKILTEPETDRIGVILAWTAPEPDYKPEKVCRIRPDFILKLSTKLTSHKHKYGSFLL